MTTIATPPTRREVERMLTTRELSRVTGIAEKTLNNWRYLRKGPAYVRCGGSIRYPLSAVREWLANGEVAASA